MTIPFTKMAGAGNDFIVIDNRDQLVPELRGKLIERWCDRRFGVGADGVLLVESDSDAHFRMRYYNADGGEAEMCGNGGRCIARFAYLNGIAPAHMRFVTIAGLHDARVTGENVVLGMTDPHSIEIDLSLELSGGARTVSFANTGVPHAVEFVDTVDTLDILRMGREIRHHERFQPAGTNAMFVETMSRNSFLIRSYERGVEDETLACGTGTTAAAILGALKGLYDPPVTGITRAGVPLTIHFTIDGASVRDVYLEGNADISFTGKLSL